MRKVFLTFLLTLSILSNLSIHRVNAINCSGDRYSVDQITSQSTKTELACFALSEYDAAANFLTLVTTDPNQDGNPSDALKNVTITYYGDNPNTTAVVETGYSKIVAADRAMAYSQVTNYPVPGLSNSVMTIYLTANLTGSSLPYMDERNQLFYYGTTRYNGSGNITFNNLSALISVNGAKGWVRVSQIQIIPLIYVDHHDDPDWAYPIDYADNTTKTIGVKQAYYIVQETTFLTVNGNLTLKQLKLKPNFVSTVDSTYDIGIAPDWLPVGTYYSPDGIYFFYDVDLMRPVYNGTSIGKFYNYYQYTNLRTKTNYTGAELNAYINYYMSQNHYNPASSTMVNTGNLFINAQNTYGMNALMILSMGALESAFGRSTYAQNPANLYGLIVKDANTLVLIPNTTVAQYCTSFPTGKYADENNVIHYCNGKYNLFGWGSVDSNPNNAAAFVSIEAGINEHMGINLRRGYMSIGSGNFYASSIGNKGAGFNTRYASDPWWSLGISGIAYKIDRYLGFKDLNSQQLGIMTATQYRYIYKEPQLTHILYTLPARATNYPFIILDGQMVNGNLVYKVQTTNPLKSDGTVDLTAEAVLVPYVFARSIGYIDADLISDYVAKFVTGVVDQGHYNTDHQIFFVSGTVTLNGSPIVSGVTVSAEGNYTVVATSMTGFVQTINFTIDLTPPVITINNYSAQPTNQNITVTASTNEGTLNSTSHTFTENGEFTFSVTDKAGNLSETTITITNIDKTKPEVTGVTNSTYYNANKTISFNEGTALLDGITFTSGSIASTEGSHTLVVTDSATNSTTVTFTIDKTKPVITINSYPSQLTNQNITVTATTNEGALDSATYTFTENGTHTFKATDIAGNVTEKTVEITNIDKVAPIITINPYILTPTNLDITVSASTNEGTLNENSHTFLRNGSFTFIATDSAGNVTSQVVTITNIAKQLTLSYPSVLTGGTLSATLNTLPFTSGSPVLSMDQITFTLNLAANYRVYRWLFNDEILLTRDTNVTFSYPYTNTVVAIEFYKVADLNDDAKVSTTDLVQLRRYIAGLDIISEKATLAADLNGDGKVSTTDLVKIRRMLAGLD